ncbi:tannase/feruloyl esterase family alpha/beta hydrolase [Terriglobus sp.]|uniref:tannase/feruloyl esterase family alpha/beta hydrolase n=1 Tax=Terriglobus sp. TaxID=1889013 RepID=UPI003AFFA4A9
MYFIGGSTGGREALKAIERWPADYDGVLTAYAAWNQYEINLQYFRVSQAMYRRGKDGQSGWMPPAKTQLLPDAGMQTCDAQDGLRDRIVSNPAACSFDPE